MKELDGSNPNEQALVLSMVKRKDERQRCNALKILKFL